MLQRQLDCAGYEGDGGGGGGGCGGGDGDGDDGEADENQGKPAVEICLKTSSSRRSSSVPLRRRAWTLAEGLFRGLQACSKCPTSADDRHALTCATICDKTCNDSAHPQICNAAATMFSLLYRLVCRGATSGGRG